MSAVSTRTFKSGNSEAVRLPQGLGFGIGTEVLIEREAGRVTLTPVIDADQQREEMARAYEDMLAIGVPPDGVQLREPFEFIDRPGLI